MPELITTDPNVEREISLEDGHGHSPGVDLGFFLDVYLAIIGTWLDLGLRPGMIGGKMTFKDSNYFKDRDVKAFTIEKLGAKKRAIFLELEGMLIKFAILTDTGEQYLQQHELGLVFQRKEEEEVT